MRRLITLGILAVTAPIAAALAWLLLLAVDLIRMRQQREPMYPVSREQRRSFNEETDAIERFLSIKGSGEIRYVTLAPGQAFEDHELWLEAPPGTLFISAGSPRMAVRR